MELTNQEYSNLVTIPKSHKAYAWNEAMVADLDELDERTQQIIPELPRINLEGKIPNDDLFDQNGPSFYIGFIGNKNYLIDTQGYSYTRKVCRLVGNIDSKKVGDVN